jgi:predicted N-acyltransferase
MQDETVSIHPAIAAIGQPAWDACAGEGNPFVSYGFLSALEDSQSVGGRSGWQPAHLAWGGRGETPSACAPAYVKSHSYGEYVFDQGWAEAFMRAGGQYYPKLQIASPFSPVPGPRLLRRVESAVDIPAFATAAETLCGAMGLSSAHVTFCGEGEWRALGAAGWLQREGTQYHWQNQGYADFEAFLAALNARKRKAVRKERREAQASGLEFRTLRGGEIETAHWQAFHQFYRATVDRKWGSAYLTPRFFPMLSERLGDRVVLMMAFDRGTPVAGALNLMGTDTLYGRNWGCIGEWPYLHFELCYYRAIEFAIANGFSRVEAGAQGEHKIQRGYLPVPTYSAHWIAHEGLRGAVADFLRQERAARAAERTELMALSPYRQEDG